MIFEVTPEHIEKLGDEDLRALLGRLCEAEVSIQGHSTSFVTWSGNQNACDGGIDVSVELPKATAISGYIPAPVTGFQSKAQDMPRGAILAEMVSDGVLRASIAEIAAQGGAYVIASSRGSVSHSALKSRRDSMVEASNGVSLTVDFYDRQRIASWVNRHPALVPWVREQVGTPLSGWAPYRDWSSSPGTLDEDYLLDKTVRVAGAQDKAKEGLDATGGINLLREKLAAPQKAVRLVGLSGVGKTRFVQALFDPRIGEAALPSSLAIYTDLSNSPSPVPLDLASHLIATRQRAILIVDNCGVALHRELVARIRAEGSLLSVITVEYDVSDDEPENTDVFKLEAGSAELIEQILTRKYPALSQLDRRKIAELSSGNFRVALALATTARGGESLANLKDSVLFKRLFEQNQGADATLERAAKVLALVYSYDGETTTGEESELAVLGALAEQSTNAMFQHTAELMRRHLVQKRSKWRAILPHAIANRLARLALEDLPLEVIEQHVQSLPSGRLLKSFSRRISFLHDSPVALTLADKWLAPGGMLSEIGRLGEVHLAVLTNVASVKPAAALRLFENAGATQGWFYTEENINRREIIRLLRLIAYDASLFGQCFSLLRRFALNESATARRFEKTEDTIVSFFTIFLSGTQASASLRAASIKSLLESGYESERTMGLAALGAMLRTRNFSSSHSFDFGARPRNHGFQPRKREDYVEWFSQALSVLEFACLGPEPEAGLARKLFADKFASLCAHAGVTDAAIALGRKVINAGGWPSGWAAVRSTFGRRGEKLSADDRVKLASFAREIRPKELKELVRSHALSREWGSLDLADVAMEELEPEAEEEESVATNANRYRRARGAIHEMCLDLGRQLASSPQDLQELLPEMLSAEQSRSGVLGEGLAAGCADLRATWKQLIDALFALGERARPHLLGGFIGGAFERDSNEAEDLLDLALQDARLHGYFLYLQCMAPISPRGVTRLLQAVDLASVPTFTFGQLSVGRASDALPDTEFGELLDKISARSDGLSVGLQVFGMRVFSRDDPNNPIRESEREIGRSLLTKLDFGTRWDAHADHMLENIVEVSLTKPEHTNIAESLCRRYLDAAEKHLVGIYDQGAAIRVLAASYPRAVLDILVEGAGKNEHLLRSLFEEVRENNSGPLGGLDDDFALGWADEQPDTRYRYLAQIVSYMDGEEGSPPSWSFLALRLIELAPSPVEVLTVFAERFQPMSWSGSMVDILVRRLPLLESLKSSQRPDLAQAAEAQTALLIKQIEEWRERETDRERARDERFE